LEPPCDVHLSDGGHFENLGLYELVRRHCRFIIVSDCGADPEYKFDDLGAALRRIRTDFGVEIDIDISPLIPGPNGRATQHMAVGTIYYDQASDLGILLLFKPNLLGEEPDDVQQYRRRNTAFPQEPTGDQFYDEAQWESYRRLGEHAARSPFASWNGRLRGIGHRGILFSQKHLRNGAQAPRRSMRISSNRPSASRASLRDSGRPIPTP
jgi:hypothetical protein